MTRMKQTGERTMVVAQIHLDNLVIGEVWLHCNLAANFCQPTVIFLLLFFFSILPFRVLFNVQKYMKCTENDYKGLAMPKYIPHHKTYNHI